MSANPWPTTLPDLHRWLKAEAQNEKDLLKAAGKDVASGTVREQYGAEQVIEHSANLEVLKSAVQDYVKVNAGANTDPVYRLSMLKALVLDRLFGEIGINRGGFGRAYADLQNQYRKNLVRMLDAMISIAERGE